MLFYLGAKIRGGHANLKLGTKLGTFNGTLKFRIKRKQLLLGNY